jgi:hypothetical protein
MKAPYHSAVFNLSAIKGQSSRTPQTVHGRFHQILLKQAVSADLGEYTSATWVIAKYLAGLSPAMQYSLVWRRPLC